MQKLQTIITLTPLRLALVLMLLLSTASCRTVGTEVVEHLLHDTLYLSHQQYDSICVLESSTEKYHPSSYQFDSLAHAYLKTDTIYRDRTKTEFRYKLLHDTTYVHRVDTVPKVIRVESPPKIRAAPALLRWLTVLAFLLFLLAILPNRK